MDNVKSKFETSRINKVNFTFLIGICLTFAAQYKITNGNNATTLSNSLIICAIIGTIVYIIPINDKVKGLMICLIPSIGNMYNLYVLDGDPRILITLLGGIAMISLYFNHKLVAVYMIIFNVAFMVLYTISPIAVTGTKADLFEAVQRLLVYDAIATIIFLLTKWGSELVDSIMIKEKASSELLEKLGITMSQIEKSTAVLSDNITKSEENIKITRSSSAHITMAVQEIAKGTEMEATSATNINFAAQSAVETVAETMKVSQEINEDIDKMSYIVKQGLGEMKNMDSQMELIKNAVGSSYSTVEDLEKSIVEINGSLVQIVDISEQTNLLSLNASIEAARAGESGRGFAVVASEVQKLAEQSGSIVKEISNVIAIINEKTKKTFEVVEKGNAAVKMGTEIVERVCTRFDEVEVSFNGMNSKIIKESGLVKGIETTFLEIERQISDVASVSEENSASTEEILAEIEEQNNKIINLQESMTEIDILCSELKSVQA